MNELIINIPNDYSKTPGGRHIVEGKFSGEDFRISCLQPVVLKAIETGAKVLVNLDGGYGYAPSFLEEAFGGLMRELSDKRLMTIIRIVSDEEPALIEDIKKYMLDALGDAK